MSVSRLATSVIQRCSHCQQTGLACLCPVSPRDEYKEKLFHYDATAERDRTTWLQTINNGLTYLSHTCVSILSVGCGVNIAAALINLALISVGLTANLTACLLFLAGTVMNWYIYSSDVPSMLKELFGKQAWFQGLFEVAGGCELLYSDFEPTAQAIGDLRLTKNSAYVRWQNRLYYVNKACKEVLRLPKQWPDDKTVIQDFDRYVALRNTAPDQKQRELSFEECQAITYFTGHTPLSILKKAMMVFCFFLAISVGAAQAVLSYNGVFTLAKTFPFLAGFPPLLLTVTAFTLASVTLVCMSALMTKNMASWVKSDNLLQDLKDYLSDLCDFSPRCEILSYHKKPEVECIESLPMQSASAYVLTEAGIFYVNKEHDEFYEIHNEHVRYFVQNMHLGRKLKIKHGDKPLSPSEQLTLPLMSYDEMEQLAAIQKKQDLAICHHRSRWGLIAGRVFYTAMNLITIPLATLGLMMTMKASGNGLHSFILDNFKSLSNGAATFASRFITMGLAFLGRSPFTFRNTARILRRLIKPDTRSVTNNPAVLQPAAADAQNEVGYLALFIDIALTVLCLSNAGGNGLISMQGGADYNDEMRWAIFLAGFWNSFTSGMSNIMRIQAQQKVDQEMHRKPEDNAMLRMHSASNSTNLLLMFHSGQERHLDEHKRLKSETSLRELQYLDLDDGLPLRPNTPQRNRTFGASPSSTTSPQKNRTLGNPLSFASPYVPKVPLDLRNRPKTPQPAVKGTSTSRAINSLGAEEKMRSKTPAPLQLPLDRITSVSELKLKASGSSPQMSGQEGGSVPVFNLGDLPKTPPKSPVLNALPSPKALEEEKMNQELLKQRRLSKDSLATSTYAP